MTNVALANGYVLKVAYEERIKVETILAFRRQIRDKLEAIYRLWKGWIERHPFIVKVYTIVSWISVIVFLLSLIFVEDSRTVFVQFLWSFYVLLQFWLICRSKTLPWKRYVAFFLAGAWIVVPITNFFMQFVHLIVGGQTSDLWSTGVLTPIAEEVFKLIPAGVYLFLSRRASSLSLTDFALIGAATGAGFQFLEETTRRLTSGFIGYGNTLFGKVIHWEVFSLFPGYFEESLFPTRTTSSHAVITALIVLGVGMAIRCRKRLRQYAYIIPACLLAMGILDHAVWNGQTAFPDWLLAIHDLLGNGYATKPLLLILLAVAIVVDYWMLNRVKRELPVLNGEPFLNPVSELGQTVYSFVGERHKFGYLLAFYRERRELGFTLLYGNAEAQEKMESLRDRVVNKWYIPLVAVSGVFLIVLCLAGWSNVWAASDNACFACLFDGLQSWWDRLEWYEKGALVLGAVALSFPFLGFWSAVGLATTAAAVAGSGRQIADVIRNPKKLLTPETAMALGLAALLSRIPGGKALSKMGKRVVEKAKDYLAKASKWLGPKLRKSIDQILERVQGSRKDKMDGPPGPKKGLKVPQGLTPEQFEKVSSMIREKAGHLGDDIVVQGSRAKGTAKPTSDIDFAIRVSEEKFEELIKQSFSKVKPPNPGSAKERTMLHAIETGKIQSGEAKLRGLRNALEAELGMDVDISIIKIGGPFDNPPFTPIK